MVKAVRAPGAPHHTHKRSRGAEDPRAGLSPTSRAATPALGVPGSFHGGRGPATPSARRLSPQPTEGSCRPPLDWPARRYFLTPRLRSPPPSQPPFLC